MRKASVIICTHNPAKDFLHRTLAALRVQTLPPEEWELLLIDNASEIQLAPQIDLSWHPYGRQIREEELGLTATRLRGIRESISDVLVFVDDDNVLDANYLEQALEVGKKWPFVGAWGGRVSPEFAVTPPQWCLEQAWRLSLSPVSEDIWSNLRDRFDTVPIGAGMCIRKEVGLRFVEWCEVRKNDRLADRTGTQLTGYGDVDLAHCALDLGLGTGKSTCLHLTHLIPASRLTLDYFVRHAEADAASLMMFRTIRGQPVQRPKNSWKARLKRKVFQLLARKSPEACEIDAAHQRGLEKGWKAVSEYLSRSRMNAEANPPIH